MHLTVVGVDHRSAPESVRARLHLDAPARRAVLARVATHFPGCEALVLATCNRTEVVLAEPEGGRAADVWHLVLEASGAVVPGAEPCGAEAVVRTRRSGDAAAEHVLRVAAGLESAVLGDVDVLRQLRQARDEAVAAGTCGKVLHRLLREALRVGKQARSRTTIAAGGAGIGSATAALVADEAPDARRVVVVGAGVAASGVLGQLRRRGVEDLVVVNRTAGRAVDVARRTGARWMPAEDLSHAVASADAVVVAAPGWSLDRAWWGDALAGRETGAPPLVVDVCMPREVGDHPGIRRRGLTAVQAHREATVAARSAAVPAAEAVVAEGLAAWTTWCDHAAFDDLVAEWYREVEEHVARLAATDADPDDVQRERDRLRRDLHHRVSALRG